MKRMIQYIAGGFLLYCTSSFVHTPEKMVRLTVELKGTPNDKGKIYVALYRKKDAFPSLTSKFRGVLVDAKQKPLQVIFQHVPADTYAVATFHDENENGIMDKNMFGVPSEVYGFSNNARKTFSAPSFQDAAFGLETERKLSIHLK